MLIAAVLCLSAPVAQAQDEPFDPREAVKKISEGFDTILESLNEMSATDASATGGEVVDKSVADISVRGSTRSSNRSTKCQPPTHQRPVAKSLTSRWLTFQ